MPTYLIKKILKWGQLCQLIIKNNLKSQFCIKSIYKFLLPKGFKNVPIKVHNILYFLWLSHMHNDSASYFSQHTIRNIPEYQN